MREHALKTYVDTILVPAIIMVDIPVAGLAVIACPPCTSRYPHHHTSQGGPPQANKEKTASKMLIIMHVCNIVMI